METLEKIQVSERGFQSPGEVSYGKNLLKKKKKVQYLKQKERIQNMLAANIVMYITEPMQKRKEIKPPS